MNILVLGAHADDPEISMGGTIKKLNMSSHSVRMVTFILPKENRSGNSIVNAKERRKRYQINAAKELGCDLRIVDMDPYTFKFNRDLVKIIDQEISSVKPDVIFTHWDNDTHQDHKAVANATFAAARKNNVTVLMYEQLTLGGISPTPFSSDVYIDISETIHKKINAVRMYEFISESDIDAIKSLAKFRGNQIGVDYAECFQVCKLIADVNNEGISLKGLWGENARRK